MRSILLIILPLLFFVYAWGDNVTSVRKTATKISSSSPVIVSKAKRSPQIEMVNSIVAYVNKGVITSNQVDSKLNQMVQSFKQKGDPVPNLIDLRKSILEQLIMQKIQLDLAARNGIKASDIEVAYAINSIAQNQHITLEQLKTSLKKQGISYSDFRDQIKTQIILEKLKQRAVYSKVNVTDDEVNRILNSEAFKNKVDYNLSDIIISIPEQASQDIINQKQQIANAAYAELRRGVSFSQVALKYSNGPNALTGGALGFKSSVTLPAMINDKLKDLSAGQYTPIIQLPMGFFIFKVNSIKKYGTPQIVTQYEVRHILVKVGETMSDSEAHQKILMVKKMLDKYADDSTKQDKEFKLLAKKYSDDTSSINGGNIGWVSKGDTVPAFEKVVMSIKPNTISDPIRTPFGWHVLEVLGTRESNLMDDKEKAEIRNELRESKGEMLYTQWLRDIRAMAYVKMNDN